MQIGIIGAGNMGTAMIKGWLKAGETEMAVMNPKNPRVSDFCQENRLSLFHDAKALLNWGPAVLVFTTPAPLTLQIVKEFQNVPTNVLMISAAAGIKLSDLNTVVPQNEWFRIIPNIPVAVYAGTIGLSSSQDAKHLNTVKQLLGKLGKVLEVQEEQLDIVGTIGGCGPAFIDVIMDALSDAAVKHGLDRKTAYQLAASMVTGTGKLALDSGSLPAELRDQVTSPGGTTIRGVAALEKHGVRYALIDAVDEASGN